MTDMRPAPSLRTQLVIWFGTLALVVAGALSLALGSMLYEQTERSQGEALRAVSRGDAQALADDLAHNRRSVEALASSTALWSNGLDSPAVHATLARVKAMNPDDSWIGVADASGVVRAATGGLLVGQDVHERPWFAPGLQGTHVGDVHAAKLLAAYLPPTANGEPRRFVDFAAPIVIGGQRVGVLAIHGSWDWADRVVEKLAPERAGELGIETFVFDRTGAMIYAKGGRLSQWAAMGQRMPPLPPGPASARSTRWRDGEDCLTAWFRVPPITPGIDLGWIIVTRQPVRVAFAAAHRAERTALAVGTTAAALATLLAWAFARRLSRPLMSIARAAHAIAGGRSSEIPTQQGSREIAELSQALAGMTSRLVAANRDLEQRVRERTEALEAANAELAALAWVDALTGLPNRRAFDEHARQLAATARRASRPLSVLIVDADHFKRVNDVHGHAAGDATLVALAGAIRARLRESDFVARLGGEEFAVLLPDTDGAGALVAADNIVAAVREIAIPAVGRVTVSCGAAEVRMPAGDCAEALARADEALYIAKREGRDTSRQWQSPLTGAADAFPPVASASLPV